MSYSSHHGPNGSFKTFSVVQRYLIPALYEGRTVVTNIRGMSNIDNIEKAYNKPLPPMAELIFVDWEDPNSPQNLDLLARWFHWIPFGALFILDECHNFYPDDTKAFFDRLEIYDKKADYYIEPDELSIISQVDGREYFRPQTITNAFRMHRHYMWDIIFTTPDIDFIPKKIRASNEYCYRHRNLAGLVPWKNNKWKEIQHAAKNSGESLSHSITTQEYTKDKRVFDCYQSTATGQYNDSIAGNSILGGTKVKVLLFFIVASIAMFIYLLSDKMAVSDIDKINSKNVSSVKKSNIKNSNIPVNTDSNQSGSKMDLSESGPDLVIDKVYPLPFGGESIVISGSMGFNGKPTQYVFTVFIGKKQRVLSQSVLMSFGYKIIDKGNLNLFIKKNDRSELFPVYLHVPDRNVSASALKKSTLVSSNNKSNNSAFVSNKTSPGFSSLNANDRLTNLRHNRDMFKL